MIAPPKPLGRSTRMSDLDYPGALRQVGASWRVSVSPDGRRYRLQPSITHSDGSRGWDCPPGLVASSLAVLLAKFGGLVDGLATAVEGLPDSPAASAPELVLQRQRLLAEIAADREAVAQAASRRV